MDVKGTYNFFDSGYQRAEFSGQPTSFYQYYLRPNPFKLPVLPAAMHLMINGHDYGTTADPSPIYYAISVTNNNSGAFGAPGDIYHVQSPLGFPSNFTDFSGDPVLDPDGIFFPLPVMGINLTDSTGNAFSSTDLPLVLPPLSAFDAATGTLSILDGNGNPAYATAEFQITSFLAVPEPTSMSVVALTCLILARRRHRAIASDK